MVTIQELTFLLMNSPNKDKIRYLELKKNPIGDKGIVILMHAIKRSKSLYHLNLSSTELTHKGAKRIFRSLREN